MRPLSLAERKLGKPTVHMGELLTGARPPLRGKTTVDLRGYAREIIASGFPGMRHLSGRALRAQLDGYLRHIVDRDFVDQGVTVRRPCGLELGSGNEKSARGQQVGLEPAGSTVG
jgi:hypothetical protein